MFTPARIAYIALSIFIAFSAGALGSWYLTDNYVTAKYEAVIAKADKEASVALAQATLDKNAAENKLNEVRNEIDKEYKDRIEKNARTIASLRAANVRLQDPGAESGGDSCPADSASPDGNTGTVASTGLLSNEASGFLFDYANEADDTLEKLRACKAWSDSVRAVLTEWEKTPGQEIAIDFDM